MKIKQIKTQKHLHRYRLAADPVNMHTEVV